VDGYQGRENTFILLSLSRSNRKRDIGFLKSQNRLNVAISRARFVLMLFGNIQHFKNHGSEVWKDFVNLLHEKAYFADK